jgi:hypothetical protein
LEEEIKARTMRKEVIIDVNQKLENMKDETL